MKPIVAAAAFALCALAAHAQFVGSSAPSRPGAKANAVTYLFPEQVTVTAGKPTPIALHFRVAQGLHINSHTPADDFLIPTSLAIPSGSGVELKSAVYPAGALTALPVDPKTRLSVYSGEFIIQAHIAAAAGNHLVQGQLHYQACDNDECMPPQTIPVVLDVIGR